MEGLISEIYGIGESTLDLGETSALGQAELFLFPLVEEDGDRSIFSRSSLISFSEQPFQLGTSIFLFLSIKVGESRLSLIVSYNRSTY